jgi:hypothetical protein
VLNVYSGLWVVDVVDFVVMFGASLKALEGMYERSVTFETFSRPPVR